MSEEVADLWLNNPDRAATIRAVWRDLGKALDELLAEKEEKTLDELRRPCVEGFAWIGQPLYSCDTCGFPAWEHEGERRLKTGASIFGDDSDWELRPWAPGEAGKIKAKWGQI